jgi:hypothetical protein
MTTSTKQPTIKETLEAIKALPGMFAKYSSVYKEFRVRHVNCPDADYFTEDRGDALMTAVKMSEQFKNF